jgi:amidase
LTSEKLVQLYLDRIEAIDKNGLQLNSIIEVNPESLAIAKNLDNETKAGKSRGFTWYSVVIKDNRLPLIKCKQLQDPLL